MDKMANGDFKVYLNGATPLTVVNTYYKNKQKDYEVIGIATGVIKVVTEKRGIIFKRPKKYEYGWNAEFRLNTSNGNVELIKQYIEDEKHLGKELSEQGASIFRVEDNMEKLITKTSGLVERAKLMGQLKEPSDELRQEILIQNGYKSNEVIDDMSVEEYKLFEEKFTDLYNNYTRKAEYNEQQILESNRRSIFTSVGNELVHLQERYNESVVKELKNNTKFQYVFLDYSELKEMVSSVRQSAYKDSDRISKLIDEEIRNNLQF
jgi:hypothetical protein